MICDGNFEVEFHTLKLDGEMQAHILDLFMQNSTDQYMYIYIYIILCKIVNNLKNDIMLSLNRSQTSAVVVQAFLRSVRNI